MSVQFIKRQARQAATVLPDFLEQHTPPFSHAQCLELVSRLHGFPTFHAAHASSERAGGKSATSNHERVVGPWWCDVCYERIANAREGYLVFNDEDNRARDFLIIHQSQCDPHGNYGSSLALDHLLGGDGLAKLLSFLAVGPIKSSSENRWQHRVGDMEAFVDLVRRVQTPGYELARRYFSDPLWKERLYDWNEYAPYVPSDLSRMLAWPISESPADAPHMGLRDESYIGHANFRWHDDERRQPVEIFFGVTRISLTRGTTEWDFTLCADGKFRCAIHDERGDSIGSAALEVVEIASKRVLMHGNWIDQDGSAEVSIAVVPRNTGSTASVDGEES